MWGGEPARLQSFVPEAPARCLTILLAMNFPSLEETADFVRELAIFPVLQYGQLDHRLSVRDLESSQFNEPSHLYSLLPRLTGHEIQ